MEAYKFSQLEYKPTDFEKVKQRLEYLTQRVTDTAGVEEVISCMQEYDNLLDEVHYAYHLAYIRSSLDCTDEFYQEAVQKEGAGVYMMDTSP